jgi:hypothetical protein
MYRLRMRWKLPSSHTRGQKPPTNSSPSGDAVAGAGLRLRGEDGARGRREPRRTSVKLCDAGVSRRLPGGAGDRLSTNARHERFRTKRRTGKWGHEIITRVTSQGVRYSAFRGRPGRIGQAGAWDLARNKKMGHKRNTRVTNQGIRYSNDNVNGGSRQKTRAINRRSAYESWMNGA